jgi:hypothetical protein
MFECSSLFHHFQEKRKVVQLKGNKLAAEICQLSYLEAKKMPQHIVFNLFFKEDSKMGSAIFVPFVSYKFL